MQHNSHSKDRNLYFVQSVRSAEGTSHKTSRVQNMLSNYFHFVDPGHHQNTTISIKDSYVV